MTNPTDTARIIRAPWTPEQVDALNAFQQRGGMHPFTCGGEHTPASPTLVAYTDGWRCPQPYGESCDYRQDWAHAFMAQPPAASPVSVVSGQTLRDRVAEAVPPLTEADRDEREDGARQWADYIRAWNQGRAEVLAAVPPDGHTTNRAGWDALCAEAGRLRKAGADLVARSERIEADVQRLTNLRADVLREAAEAVQSSDVRYNTEAVEAALKNGGPFALIAYIQLAIGEHLGRLAAEAPQPEPNAGVRAELKPWQLLGDQPDEPLPQTEQLRGGRRLEPAAGVRQQPDTETPFVTRVLEIFAAADAHGELLWHIADGQPQFSANVSDVFAWGGADCEPITPETLPVLEQALADLRAIGAEDFVADLYAARLRQMRPQGAAYPSGTHKAWREVSALYDACGPERELGLGNPKPAPAHQPAAVAPAAGAGQDETQEADRVVAYRSALPGAWSVYCTLHVGELGACTPLTADDLPDGGLCAQCGVDVLIEQPSATADTEAKRCPAKHGALGRICELPLGHTGMHTGSGLNGSAVWDGDAP
ncbi:hypothetical protein [Streptomyces griseorubiginosus]|uniref:hypothetical protein n=1 Tax=Streptomyces griseorubiginosus TaxID=67304 RepID=UPI003333E171